MSPLNYKTKKECVFIDVFTDIPFSGNQLAVFPYADDLNSDQMQALTSEINYSSVRYWPGELVDL